MAHDRRRYPRATVRLAVTLEAESSQWHAKTLNLSPYGVKVASVVQVQPLRPGSSVQLRVALPDQDTPLALPASVVRTDPDGVALKFESPGDSEFRRVKDLVDSLLQREWREVLHEIGGAPSPPAPTGPAGTAFRPPNGNRARVQWAFGARDPGAPASASAEAGPRRGAGELSPTTAESEKDRWLDLLNRRGLGKLQLPGDGALSRQWRELLTRLEAEESQDRQ